MKNINFIFGKILRTYRLKNRLTQENLSELSFINVKTISEIENGKTIIDIEKLEAFSKILNVDFVKIYFDLYLDDSKTISRIINSLNTKDNIAGFNYTHEIITLLTIENSTCRYIVKIKARKSRLFFENLQIKDNKNKRKAIIVEALNTGKTFDFSNLDTNTYDCLDYRLIMNYTQIIDCLEDKFDILFFLENSDIQDDILNSILYHNIALTYYNLNKSKIALIYINKAIELNSKYRISPIMLYIKSIILYDLSLDYEKVFKDALIEAKKNNNQLYSIILDKNVRKSLYQKDSKIINSFYLS